MPILTNAGKAIITNRITGAGTEPRFIGFGTGTTPEAANQTALTTEVQSRVSGTPTRETGSVANDTYQVVATMTADASRAVTEAGMFDASTTGNLFVRALFSVINLASGDQLQLTFRVTFA